MGVQVGKEHVLLSVGSSVESSTGSTRDPTYSLESQWLIIRGYFKPIDGLLWGIVAYYFQLLGSPGLRLGTQRAHSVPKASSPSQLEAKKASTEMARNQSIPGPPFVVPFWICHGFWSDLWYGPPKRNYKQDFR